MTHAVEVERLQLGRVNDVPDRYLGGRPSEDVAAASTTRAGDDSCAPQAQQDLLDVVGRQSFLPRNLASVDRPQLSSLGEVQRADDAVLCPRSNPHVLRIRRDGSSDKAN